MEDVKARRSKIEEKAPRLLAALRKGYSKSDSYRVAGIHRDTLANWLKRAEDLDAPDEYVQFYFDYHEARAKGLDKLLKDLDKFDNKTETRVVEKVLVEKGETDDETVERVIERTTTTKHEKGRASHFQRALVKLRAAYPDRWGQNPKGEDDTEGDDERSVTDLFDQWAKELDVGDRCDRCENRPEAHSNQVRFLVEEKTEV